MKYSNEIKNLNTEELLEIVQADIDASTHRAPEFVPLTWYVRDEYPELYHFIHRVCTDVFDIDIGDQTVPESVLNAFTVNAIVVGAICRALEIRDLPDVDF